MQIIDVTLRDGGHVREFNWPIKFAQDHYKSLCKIPEIKFIELGKKFIKIFCDGIQLAIKFVEAEEIIININEKIVR